MSQETASSATSITNTNTDNAQARAVYIGVDDNYDFYINGAWVSFYGTKSGSSLPIRPQGARHTSGSTAPDAGDIVFLY